MAESQNSEKQKGAAIPMQRYGKHMSTAMN